MKTIAEYARAGEALTGIDIIDVHAHLGPGLFPVLEWEPDDVVAAADHVGVDELWVSHMGIGAPDFERKNAELAAWVKRHPDRLRAYLTPPPWSADETRKQTETYLAEGFVGIKLHNINGIPYDAPEYEPLWVIAHERRLPVLLHTWGEAHVFDSVEKILERHPDVAIIMGHGMQRNSTAKYEHLAREHEHLYLDTCVSSSPRGRIEELVERVGADKVVFGSDIAFLSLDQQIGKVALADIDEEAKHQILAGNARRILKRIVQ